MPALTLEKYIARMGFNQHSFAKDIGRSHQIVKHWVKNGETVELTDVGIKIKSEKIVYETQVAK